MATGTLTKLTTQFSQVQYNRYVTHNIRAMTKARDAGHKDFRAWTDTEIADAAHHLARMNNAGAVYVTA